MEDKTKDLLLYILESKSLVTNIDIVNGTISTIEGLDLNSQTININKYTALDFNGKEEIIESPDFKNSITKFKDRGIILIDIVGYSKGEDNYQAALLNLFNNSISQALKHLKMFGKDGVTIIEQIIPTGDGCYLIFSEDLNERFLLAVFHILSSFKLLQNEFYLSKGKNPDEEKFVELRIGIELGSTSHFIDVAGNTNYFGTGLNEAARILTYGQKEFEKHYPQKPSSNLLFVGENVFSQANNIVNHIKKFHDKIGIIKLENVGLAPKKWTRS